MQLPPDTSEGHGYTVATPGVKKLSDELATKKALRFAVRLGMISLGNLPGDPSPAACTRCTCMEGGRLSLSSSAPLPSAADGTEADVFPPTL